MGRREEVLAAAVDVLGTRGSRGLSHRAVDTAAGVPEGTTSNHFRSRLDLLLGIREHLAAQRPFDEPLTFEVDDGAALIRRLAAATRYMLDSNRSELIAGMLLFFESVRGGKLADELATDTTRHWRRLATQLAELGAPDPETGAKLLLGYQTAVGLAQYVDRSPEFDPEAMLEPLVWGLLHDGSTEAG